MYDIYNNAHLLGEEVAADTTSGVECLAMAIMVVRNLLAAVLFYCKAGILDGLFAQPTAEAICIFRNT